MWGRSVLLLCLVLGTRSMIDVIANRQWVDSEHTASGEWELPKRVTYVHWIFYTVVISNFIYLNVAAFFRIFQVIVFVYQWKGMFLTILRKVLLVCFFFNDTSAQFWAMVSLFPGFRKKFMLLGGDKLSPTLNPNMGYRFNALTPAPRSKHLENGWP